MSSVTTLKLFTLSDCCLMVMLVCYPQISEKRVYWEARHFFVHFALMRYLVILEFLASPSLEVKQEATLDHSLVKMTYS